MNFEWDERKRLANIEKHGFDFIRAPELFSSNHLRTPARDGKDSEERWMATGLIQGRYATAIYTMRGGVIRMISLRSARHDERQAHQEVFS